MRRQCELCGAQTPSFVACSAACLKRHRLAEHPQQPACGALELMADANTRHGRAWELYAEHRQQIAQLIAGLPRGGRLCVLGAGNCDDLELASLLEAFSEVHLVDIDATALGRAAARLPEAERARVTLHGGVDLAGHLDQMDAWERAVPSLSELLPSASARASGIAAAIAAGRFEVVLSTCVLTQLSVPFKRTLVLSAGEWQRVFAVLGLTHLLTIAQLVQPGGTGVLVTDVAAKPLNEPNLELLSTLLAEHPELRTTIADARRAEPWLWTLDGRVAVTHAIVLQAHAAARAPT